MKELSLAVTLHVDTYGIADTTLHGKLREGKFFYTDLSQGRAAGQQELLFQDHVVAVTEEIDGQPFQETRVISLGAGVLYQFEGSPIKIKNVNGYIFINTQTDWQDQEGWTQISSDLIIGGQIPNTIFQAQDQPGFSFAAQQ